MFRFFRSCLILLIILFLVRARGMEHMKKNLGNGYSIMSITKEWNKILPGCNTSGIERIPDALTRRFRWPYVSFIDNADAWNIMNTQSLTNE